VKITDFKGKDLISLLQIYSAEEWNRGGDNFIKM
jgi:hypothetical protein